MKEMNEVRKMALLKYAGLEMYADKPNISSFADLVSDDDRKWIDRARCELPYCRVGWTYTLQSIWSDEPDKSKWLLPKKGETATREIVKYGKNGVEVKLIYEYKFVSDPPNTDEFGDLWEVTDETVGSLWIEIVNLSTD